MVSVQDQLRSISTPRYPDITERHIELESHFDVGAFSEIWRGHWRDKTRTQQLAIKFFRLSKRYQPKTMADIRSRLERGAEVWRRTQHSNVLPLLGLYVKALAPFPALVLPLRHAGNILNFLRTSNPNNRILSIGIADGLAYLHTCDITHGHLTPNNVLIHIDNQGQPVPQLSDFGRVNIHGIEGFSEVLHTTNRYTAPEVLLNLPPPPNDSVVLPLGANWLPTKYSDAYSLGMVILHVVSGIKPYYHWNEAQISLAVSNKKSAEPKLVDYRRNNSMEWIWPLLCWCWGFGKPPEERCTASRCSQYLSGWRDPKEDITPELRVLEDPNVTQISKSEEVSILSTIPEVEAVQASAAGLARATNGLSYKKSNILSEPASPQSSISSMDGGQELRQLPADSSSVLGDYIPFTLESRHMAGYIATMSADRQEGFEVEIAQTKARLELQGLRKAKQAEAGLKGITQSTAQYKDLSGLIHEREDFPFHENCSIGYLTEDGGTRTKAILHVDQKDEVIEHLIQKAPIWRQLKHTNILEFLGLSFDSWKFGDPAIVYPYCFNGTLSRYGRHAEVNMRLFMIKGVSEGLQYLHGMQVIHGDLQPSRVFVHDDGHPVISGFGFPEVLTIVEDNSIYKPREERHYQAVELVIEDGIHPNKASDVCAFALTAYEIWTGMQPFEDVTRDLDLLYSNDSRGTVPRYPDHEPPGTGSLWQLFEGCWGRDPDGRLTMAEVVERLGGIHDPSGKGKSKLVWGSEDDYN